MMLNVDVNFCVLGFDFSLVDAWGGGQAIQKLRGFLWQRFNSLRKKMTNIQIKQTVLLKYKYGFEFLGQHAAEVRLRWVTVRILLSLFIRWSDLQ